MAASDLAAELAKSEARIVTHMNDDHADSLLAYAHYFAAMPDAVRARMTGLSVSGFELCVTVSSGAETSVVVPYDPPIRSAIQVRKVAVAMHFKAFNSLGFRYKLFNGFYSGAVRMMWTHMPPLIRNTFLGSVFGVTTLVYLRIRRR